MLKSTKLLINSEVTMKTIAILCLFLTAGISTAAHSQSKVKEYSFAVYLSNGTASSKCADIKEAYVSPVIAHRFDDYRIGDSEDDVTDELNMKWAKKCELNLI